MRGWMKRFDMQPLRLRIRHKVGTVLLGLTLLLMIIIGVFYQKQSNTMVKTLVKEQLFELTHKIADQLNMLITNNTDIVSLVSNTTQLTTTLDLMLKAPEAQRYPYQYQILEMLLDIKNASNSIKHIYITDLEGGQLLSTDPNWNSDTINPSLYKNQLTKAYINRRADDNNLLFPSYLIIDNENLAIIILEFYPETYMASIAIGGNIQAKEHAILYYRDSKGNPVLFNPSKNTDYDNDLLNKVVVESKASIPTTSISLDPMNNSSQLIGDSENANLSGVTSRFGLGHGENYQITNSSLVAITDIDNVDHFAVSVEFSFLNLGIVLRITQKEALSIVDEQMEVLLYTFALVLLLLFFVVAVVGREMLKPLHDMKEIASMIANGDLSKRISHSSNDEIGELGKMLNIMTDNLIAANHELDKKYRDKTDELSDANRHLSKVNSELMLLSMTDSLTSVANRRAFDFLLPKEWKRCQREQVSIAMLMFDIDFFKRYNDSLGHAEGDKCLVSVTNVLAKWIRRETDMLARYGGEEFVAILPNTDQKEAMRIADRIIHQFEIENIHHPDSDVCSHVSVSIGCAACVPGKQVHFNKLLNKADMAMYQAKRDGRNRVCFIGVD